MRRLAIALAGIAVLLAGCGMEGESTPSAEVFRAQGDDFAREGDWMEAAERYRRAFAVEDPIESRAAPRAYLAYLRGLALARYGRAEDAGRWFDRALRLDADLYVVHFERGLLHDGSHPETADAHVSRAAFQRYLDGWEAAGSREADAAVAEEARRRLETLDDTPEAGD